MQRERFPWKRDYQFVEPGITADGVRIYPFDRGFPIDVAFVRASGPKHVRLNRHEFFEVMYVYGGKTELQVRDRYFPLRAGDLVVMGPHIYHRVLHKPNVEAKLVSLNFHPEVIRSGDAGGEEESYLSTFLCQDTHFQHVISGRKTLSREVFRLILKVHEELPARTPLNRLAVKTYLKLLLLLLLKHFADYLGTRQAIDRKQKDVQRLRPLFQVIDERYAQHIEVRDAARICGMSPSHFMRFFKQTMGQPFRAYLSAFRIAKAQSMLASDDASIAEISQQVGFCSQSYFGEMFRALAGMTPRTYRQRFRAQARLS